MNVSLRRMAAAPRVSRKRGAARFGLVRRAEHHIGSHEDEISAPRLRND